MQDVKANESYDIFKSMVVEQVRERVEGRVILQKVTKNNSLELDGLTIVAEDVNVSPTIYLNYYYDKFLASGISAVINEIIEVYEKNKPKTSFDCSVFTDAEKVSGIIKMKLINYDKNKELLKQVPHIKYLDLAIVFYAEIESKAEGVATILIHNNHLSSWKFTTEDLFKLADENMAEDFEIISMYDIICGLTSEEMFEQDVRFEMDVLTNKLNLNGAIGMLQTKLLQEYMEKYHTKKLIILPSSTHEVLLIPYDPETDAISFKEMVQQVNATELRPEEVLSDNAYIYDGNEIKIIE